MIYRRAASAVYRERYLARHCAVQVTRPPQTGQNGDYDDMKTFSQFCNDLTGVKMPISRAEAYKIHQHRAARNEPSNLIALPLTTPHDEIVALLAGRKKNINSTRTTVRPSYLQEHNEGRYSSRCSYTHYTYTPRIKTLARIVGRHILYTIDTNGGLRHGKFLCPRGYRLERDTDNALMLVGAAGEIHLDTRLVLRGGVEAARQLRENAARRKLVAKISKERAKDVARTWITPLDARIAGNCAAGIRNFAARVGADLDNPYVAVPAAVALRAANEVERERVEKTIAIAFIRETCVMI